MLNANKIIFFVILFASWRLLTFLDNGDSALRITVINGFIQ